MAIARRARCEILRAGEGGEAMAARLELMRGDDEEQVGGVAAGQNLGDMVADEQGGGDEQVGLAGEATDDQERTDGDDGEEDLEDGEQVRRLSWSDLFNDELFEWVGFWGFEIWPYNLVVRVA